MALACQLPLRDFLTKMEKYEAALGPFSSPQWFRGLPQKSKWAVTFAEEVEKMRALVAAKTVSISLLLAMDLSYGSISLDRTTSYAYTLVQQLALQDGGQSREATREGTL